MALMVSQGGCVLAITTVNLRHFLFEKAGKEVKVQEVLLKFTNDVFPCGLVPVECMYMCVYVCVYVSHTW